MIRYTIMGCLGPGVSWEDFYCRTEGHPHVTIETAPADGDPDTEIETVFEKENESENGVWFGALVTPALTRETARYVLAKINGVQSRDIRIEEQNFCTALGD